MKKQQIKNENLISIEFNNSENQKCHESHFLINGIKPGKGIGNIHMELIACEQPKITIIGFPDRIPIETKEAWGLSVADWIEIENQKSGPEVEIKNILPLDYPQKNQAEE